MTVTFYKDKWTEENLKKLGLNDRQIKAVIYINENVKITNKKYQELNNVSKRTATRDFENLIKKDIIIQIGITGRGTEYTLKWGHKGVKGVKGVIKTPNYILKNRE